MEIPLLLVGDELDGDQGDESAADCHFRGGHGRVDAGREQEDVGGCGDREEEDLVFVLARCPVEGARRDLRSALKM